LRKAITIILSLCVMTAAVAYAGLSASAQRLLSAADFKRFSRVIFWAALLHSGEDGGTGQRGLPGRRSPQPSRKGSRSSLATNTVILCRGTRSGNQTARDITWSSPPQKTGSGTSG
jgi:hypothetical protein